MTIPFIAALLAKLTVILGAGLIATAILRSASPSLRHLALLATIVCGLTLPVAMLISPTWDVAILPRSANLPSSRIGIPASGVAQNDNPIPISEPRSVETGTNASPPTGGTGPSGVAGDQRASAIDFAELSAFAVPLAYVFGFTLIIAWLVIGRIRLRRIASEAWPLDRDWHRILAESCEEAAVMRGVRLLSSSVVSSPLTWGSISPIILLPEDAVDWSEDHRRVVLRHELAHVARRDSLAQLVAGLVCALYWFHPLVWIAERRLRAECERACDERVVSLGTPPTEYASHLLEVARSARAFGAAGFLSVAMARPSQLEGRLLAVLNNSRRRASASRGARTVALLLTLLLMLPLAAFRPVAKEVQPGGKRLARVIRPTLVEHGPQLIYPRDLVPETAPGPVTAHTRQVDSTLALSAPVRSGGTLNLELKTGGGITITGWDRPQVAVRAELGGRDWRLTRVTLEPSDGNATLESSLTRYTNNQSTRHHFDIQVPHNFNIRINSAGGQISINDVDGTFTGQTGGGQINITKANGDVDIRTGGGQIFVGESRLSGSVSTGGGMVRIVGVDGNLYGSSGSGPVIYTNSRDPKHQGLGIGVGKGAAATTTYIDNGAGKGYGYGSGAINMVSAGGPLSLPAAPDGARVTTGGGRISIGPSGGEVYAHTGGGPIDIGPATGSVTALTGAGDVNIELKGAGSHDVDVTSGKGQVVLVLPSDLNATLELETAYTNNFDRKTRIVSDWPVTITETKDWDSSQGTPRKYVRVRQSVGRGGGLIRVHTVNGNIVLKRGS